MLLLLWLAQFALAQAPTSAPVTASQPAESLPLLPDMKIQTVADPQGGGSPLWTMLSSVLIILALGAVAIFFVKRILPKLGGSLAGGAGSSRGRSMRVSETLRLGQQRHVHLLETHGRTFLVSDSPQGGIRLLAELKPADVSDSKEAQA